MTLSGRGFSRGDRTEARHSRRNHVFTLSATTSGGRTGTDSCAGLQLDIFTPVRTRADRTAVPSDLGHEGNQVPVGRDEVVHELAARRIADFMRDRVAARPESQL